MFDSFTVKRNTHTSCVMTRPVSKVCHFAYENDYFSGIKFQETGEVDFATKIQKLGGVAIKCVCGLARKWGRRGSMFW